MAVVKKLLIFAAVYLLLCASIASAQVSTTGTLLGTVTDATGAVVSGARIFVKDQATGAVIETQSGPDGTFTAASLRPGLYIVTVALEGFKTAEFRSVKIVVGGTYDLQVKLEVGTVQSTVVVEAGAEVMETASTSVSTTVTGRSITQLPFTSRDTLDLATLMPGASTTGRARQTSFLGLPKGAINITYDGINVQDNVLKSNDGFFTNIRPRVDSVEEFSISTAGQGAEQSGEGAVQIRFETKRGGNEYHGGGWWYHRNDFFNANYYFSNLTGLARQRQRMNQFGGKVGGPILKDKVFFFVAVDNYRLPGSQIRSRTILAPGSLAGNFEYGVTAIPGGTLPAWITCNASSPRNSGGPTCTANLVAMGTAQGQPLNFDTNIMSILNAVNSSRSVAGVRLDPVPSPHVDQISFNNPGNATRRYPDLRLDWNINSKNQLSFIYHYQYFTSTPDFLNGYDQTFPVAPFNTNQGSQISNRNQWTGAWRYNLTSAMSNEVRWGLQTAPLSFYPDLDLSGSYALINNNLGSVNLRPVFPTMISAPILLYNTQGRNAPVNQLIETFSWARGKHFLTLGGSWTELRMVNYFASRAVHSANIGMASSDPAAGMFSSANMPGSSSTQRTNASTLFAILAGRISSYTGTTSVNEDSRVYDPGKPLKQRVDQTEFGIYGTDSWRILPSLTLNMGLRWEYQGAPKDPKNITFRASQGAAGAWGISGESNLFSPGTVSGQIPTFELNGDRSWYEKDMNNFAPNFGFAWTPNLDKPWYNALFGGPGKSVFRGSYSIAFTREGVNNFLSIAFSNPGVDASIFSNAVAPTSPPALGSHPAGGLTYTGVLNGQMQSAAMSPSSFVTSGSFQITPFSGQAVNVFAENLGIPTVQSWSFGIQRQITPDMVFEARYVGNHGTGLWRQVDLNQLDVLTNGFLQEFINAKSNLAAFRAANPLCGQTGQPSCSFANNGLSGQVALPILQQAFTGLAGSSSFTSGTFISNLDLNLVGSMANTLAFSSTYMCRLVGTQALQGGLATSPCAAGLPLTTSYPVNFWVANPHALGPSTATTGGAFLMTNAGHSTYNGLQLELRQRPKWGLMFSGNYTWSKSLTNYFADSSVNFAGFTSYRNPKFDKGPSPWDLRHVFKMQLIYELPFGSGKRWSANQAWMNHIIGGWEVSTIQRWQTGRVFQLNSGQGGTLNASDPGIRLIGITAQQLQSMLEVRKTPTGQIFYFPASLIGSNGQANRSYMRPCGEGTVSEAGALCDRIYLYGPMFYRSDINIVKRFRITERWNLEYRAEFLNAFNNINFFFPGSETTSAATTTLTSSTFGRITNAFRDVSTTDDNGGRIIQMVFRINF